MHVLSGFCRWKDAALAVIVKWAPECSGQLYFRGALLSMSRRRSGVIVAWIDRLELRNIPTLGLQATLPGYYDRKPALGDVDGDGLVDLVVCRPAQILSTCSIPLLLRRAVGCR